MQLTAAQLSDMFNGTLEGNAQACVNKVAKIEEGDHESLSFLANPKYESFLYETSSSVVLVSHDFKASAPVKATLVRVRDPYAAFTKILQQYMDFINKKTGIESPNYIHESASLGQNVYIGAFSYIGQGTKIADDVQIYPNCYIGDGARIGKGSIIYPGVKIYRESVIGDHCVIHAGSVIGADGFGFAPQPEGHYEKIPQVGNVVIENFVEIGANTCIDRATMGSTIIRQGVKLDNLIQIAHNAEVGEHSAIAAQVGISGSTKLGKRCVVGGQVGFAGHLSFADGTKIGAQSGLMKGSKMEEAQLMGSPAIELKDYLKSQAIFRNLPQLDKKLNELKIRIQNLERNTNPS